MNSSAGTYQEAYHGKPSVLFPEEKTLICYDLFLNRL
jgi:hypothetical protein